MIFDAILWIIYQLLYGVLSVLPTMEALGETWTSAWTFLATSFGNLLYLLPADVSATVLTVMNIILLFELTLFGFWIFDKIFGWVRG